MTWCGTTWSVRWSQPSQSWSPLLHTNSTFYYFVLVNSIIYMHFPCQKKICTALSINYTYHKLWFITTEFTTIYPHPFSHHAWHIFQREVCNWRGSDILNVSVEFREICRQTDHVKLWQWLFVVTKLPKIGTSPTSNFCMKIGQYFDIINLRTWVIWFDESIQL